MADAGSPSPDPPPPLLQFRSLSAPSTRLVARYGLRAPSPSLRRRTHPKMRRHEPVGSFAVDLEVFLTVPRTRARRPAPFALGVTPASGSGRHATRTSSRYRDARAHTGLPGFRPLRRSQVVASTNVSAATFASAARACLTRYGPSPGSLTLLTVYSTTTPVGLFHPTRALGVPPFRAFSRRAGTPLDVLCPPDVSPIDPPRRPLRRPAALDHGPIAAVSTRASPEADPRRLQGFAPSGGPEHRRGGLGRGASGSSLGLAPLQGFTGPRRTRCFTPGNFLELRANAFPATGEPATELAIDDGPLRSIRPR